MGAAAYPDDINGIYRPSCRPIRRLGLLLDPEPSLPDWVTIHQLDALWLHRPWKLDALLLPSDIGVLAYHLAFDEHLTLGFNPHLATALGMADLEALGEKAGRCIGMIGTIAPQDMAAYCRQVMAVFNGVEEIRCSNSSSRIVTRVAVVGAMTATLIQDAYERQVDLYITGQFRVSATAAVAATGMDVIAVGHRRSEQWGLNALAKIVRARWPELQVLSWPEQA
ncbi:MAG: Nif3-like dinuclear metal center hexameric protein [Synechococcales cyanobacterium C42_A2020_086]|nr:Nif3-like dinuclear metal center hexameric protein [Synechococcales cyanobacterium C42_A2020_086]